MEDKQKKYSDLIVQFLKENSFISANAIESALDMPQGTLYRAKNGKPIPIKYIFDTICVLAQYGLKIDDYHLKYEKIGHSLFGFKLSTHVKTIEVLYFADGSTKELEISESRDESVRYPNSTGSSFKYIYEVDKIFFSDYFDLF